ATSNQGPAFRRRQQDAAQATSEMSIHVVKNPDDFRRGATDPEEADPASEVPVRSRDTSVERLPPGTRREPPDLGRQTIRGSLRQQHLDLAGLPVTAKTKTDEVPLLGLCHSGLGRAHLEATTSLDAPHAARHSP